MTEREQFDALVDRVLAVPHAEIQRRERAYKETSAKNPKRRGPKKKQEVSSFPDPAVSHDREHSK